MCTTHYFIVRWQPQSLSAQESSRRSCDLRASERFSFLMGQPYHQEVFVPTIVFQDTALARRMHDRPAINAEAFGDEPGAVVHLAARLT